MKVFCQKGNDFGKKVKICFSLIHLTKSLHDKQKHLFELFGSVFLNNTLGYILTSC